MGVFPRGTDGGVPECHNEGMQYHEVRDPQRLQSLISAILLFESDVELDALLRHLVRSACELVGAEYAALGVLDRSGSFITDFITFGIDDETRQRIGDSPEGHGLLGEVIRAHHTVRVDDLRTRELSVLPEHHPEMYNFLGTPVRTGDGTVFGNLYLANKRDGAFSDEDEALLSVLGRATGLVIDQARLRDSVRSLTLLEERNRLARDLHDSVIQRIFAVGLSLQATLMNDLPRDVATQVDTAIDELDETIREIRTTIFEISHRDDGDVTTLRGAVLRVIDELPSAAGLNVDVAFDGPLDSVVGPDCADAIVLSLREMLSNVVRHADATRAVVTLSVQSDVVTMSVADNGRGVSDTTGGSGLGNLRSRAEELGGSFALSSRSGGGSIATWTAERVRQ